MRSVQIYVITQGCYSGYTIVSMHSSKEKADQLVKEYNDERREKCGTWDWLKNPKNLENYINDYGQRVEVWNVS